MAQLEQAYKSENADELWALLDEKPELATLSFSTHQMLPHMAARGGRLDILEELSRRGVDILQPNHRGETALHAACGSKQIETAEYLLDHGADIEAQWTLGTPLCEAVRRRDIEMLEFLLRRGANLNPPRVYTTPLLSLYRPEHGQPQRRSIKTLGVDEHKIAKALFAAGASPFHPNSQGESVISDVAKAGDLKLFNELTASGIEPCELALDNAVQLALSSDPSVSNEQKANARTIAQALVEAGTDASNFQDRRFPSIVRAALKLPPPPPKPQPSQFRRYWSWLFR